MLKADGWVGRQKKLRVALTRVENSNKMVTPRKREIDCEIDL